MPIVHPPREGRAAREESHRWGQQERTNGQRQTRRPHVFCRPLQTRSAGGDATCSANAMRR